MESNRQEFMADTPDDAPPSDPIELLMAVPVGSHEEVGALKQLTPEEDEAAGAYDRELARDCD